MEEIIQIREELSCDIQTVFNFFTINKYLESWLTEKADIEPRVGGKYELFWDPNNKVDNSTLGCKITGIETNKFISFNWKDPVQFRSFMNFANPLTHVIVFFSKIDKEPDKTTIHLFHTGWRDDPSWEEARNYFENAWLNALQGLKERIMRKELP